MIDVAKANEDRDEISQNESNIRGEDTSLRQALWGNREDIERTGA